MNCFLVESVPRAFRQSPSITLNRGIIMSTIQAWKYLGRSLLALVGTIALSASAEDVKVSLTGDEEVPPVTTAAKGEGTITVGQDKTVTGSVTTTGVEGVAAHIHVAEKGKNGPPVITLVKSGDNKWTTPPDSKLTDEQYKSFKAGHLYVNVHSPKNKGGEIRGQLKP
jgi:hypothetical protein